MSNILPRCGVSPSGSTISTSNKRVEYGSLLNDAGFKLVQIVPTSSAGSVVEAVLAD